MRELDNWAKLTTKCFVYYCVTIFVAWLGRSAFISPQNHFTPYHFTPYHFTPYHFTPYQFTPYHFTPRSFQPAFISPHVHFTPHSFHPTFTSPHNLISQMRLRLITLLTTRLWTLPSCCLTTSLWLTGGSYFRTNVAQFKVNTSQQQ